MLARCSLQLQELLWRFCKKSVEYLLSPASLETNNGPLFGVAVGPIRPKDERTNQPTNKWKRHPLNQFHDVRRVALPREFVFDERCTRSADPNPSIRVARANMNRRERLHLAQHNILVKKEEAKNTSNINMIHVYFLCLTYLRFFFVFEDGKPDFALYFLSDLFDILYI